MDTGYNHFHFFLSACQKQIDQPQKQDQIPTIANNSNQAI